jgi:hypothetical protein
MLNPSPSVSHVEEMALRESVAIHPGDVGYASWDLQLPTIFQHLIELAGGALILIRAEPESSPAG